MSITLDMTPPPVAPPPPDDVDKPIDVSPKTPTFRPIEPGNRISMESPTVSPTSDPAVPDRKPTPGIATDTPEARMALRNEGRIERDKMMRGSLLARRMSLLERF